jgi:hypothetical protein
MLKCVLFYNNQSSHESLVVLVYGAVLFSSTASISEYFRRAVRLLGCRANGDTPFEDVASFPDNAFKPFHKDLRLGFAEKPVWVKLRISPQSPHKRRDSFLV